MTAKAQSGASQLKSLGADEWLVMVSAFAEALDDPATRRLLAAAFGDAGTLEHFAAQKGVGIGSFASLVQLPVSTVRHYVELGLIEPYLVNGKFRFVAPNLAEIRSVRAWLELGLSLQQMVERKRQTGALPAVGSSLEGEPVMVQVVRIGESDALSDALSPSRIVPLEEATRIFREAGFDPAQQARLQLEDLNAQIERLESEARQIASRLETARALKEQIELTWKLGGTADQSDSNRPA